MAQTEYPHFLPKTYLKKFRIVEERGDFAYTARRTEKGWSKVLKRPKEKICTYKNLYTKLQKWDTQTHEKKFGKVESDYGKVASKLTQYPYLVKRKNIFRKTEILEREDVETLSKFILMQYKRHPDQRDVKIKETIEQDKKIKKGIKKIKNKTAALNLIAHSAFTDGYLTEENIATTQWIGKGQWKVHLNDTSLNFITSDNPILWLTEFKEGMEKIIFVLSPKYLLEISLKKISDKIEFIYQESEKMVDELNTILIGRAQATNAEYSRIISNQKGILEKYIANFDPTQKQTLNRETKK